MQTFDMTQASSYNPAFVTLNGSFGAAEAALLAGLHAGTAYLNIHTSMFPGGEIRGFLGEIPTAVQMRQVTAASRARTSGFAGGRRPRRERSGSRSSASEQALVSGRRTS